MSATTTTTHSGLPRALPLLGHALQVLRNPLTFLEAARPLGPIVKIRLGSKDAYIVNSPDLVRQILVVDTKKYGKGVVFDKLRPVLGNGLVTAAGEDHRRHRRLVQPAFHHARIAGYAQTMRQLAVAKAESWHDGSEIALDRELTELTLRIVGKTLFSTALGEAAVDEVVRSMPTILNGITKRALSPVPLLEKLPTAENRRFNAAIRRMRDVVDRIVAEYRLDGSDHGDMVSMLLLARDEETGEGLSDEQIRDEVVTMLMAGTETTANLLSWTLHVLGQHPDIEARLHAEVDEVLGDGELAFEDIGKLAYVRRVITETLRLYPPSWMLTRRTEEEVTLGGMQMAKGTSVLFSQYTMQRDPEIYPQADVFDPDRWLPERAQSIPRPAFVPFGAGNRQCIGEGFAWTEAIVLLATISRSWRLRPVPGVVVTKVPSATLTPSALPMITLRRAARSGQDTSTPDRDRKPVDAAAR